MNETMCVTLALVAIAAVVACLWLAWRTAAMKTLLGVREEEKTGLESRLAEAMARQETMTDEVKHLTAERQALAKELALAQEQARRDEQEREQQFGEQLKLVREQLQNATREMLRERARELAERNNEQMSAIIDPLKNTMREMRESIDQSRDTHNRNTATLERAIEEVMKRTVEIGAEADKLATALRGESKVQGNWGELILDELLQGQGLQEGVHYDKQATLRDQTGRVLVHEESGKRMIPDTVLHYPDGKDAIIDSKVSLTAFVDYQNAETDEAREEAAQRHLRSVRQHVTELARKDYSAYIKAPRQALNYVIMFVPNEGALQLALTQDPLLWREAFAKGVFITGEQNLTAALRIIQIAWTQMLQERNQEAIFDTARMLLDRVADYVKYMDEVGRKLQDAQTAFVKASDKLRDGRQSVVGASNKLIKLGAKTSAGKKLPEENAATAAVE